MGDVTPIRGGRVRPADKVADLPIIDDVDDMLREGVSAKDVVKHIQETFELLQDMKHRTLYEVLRERRKNLPQPEPDANEWPAAHGDVGDARTPGAVAHNQYVRATRGLDILLETESLYLSQRDRIDRLVSSENTTGEPYEEMPREMNTALEMLKTHAKLQEQFGPAMNRMKLSLEIQGGAEDTLGNRVQGVMKDPESRHKVLSMFKRLGKLAQIPEVVGDAEAEPVGSG